MEINFVGGKIQMGVKNEGSWGEKRNLNVTACRWRLKRQSKRLKMGIMKSSLKCCLKKTGTPNVCTLLVVFSNVPKVSVAPLYFFKKNFSLLSLYVLLIQEGS